MQSITNNRLLESRGKIGKRVTWGGFILVFGSLGVLYLPIAESQMLSMIVMLGGFLITNVGMYYFNRYVRPPLFHTLVEEALKGLDNRYRLYNYMGPVDHVLLTPNGVMAITVRRMGGVITCIGDKWSTRTGILSRLRFTAEDQLANPSADLRQDVSRLQALLEAKLPDDKNEKPVPIGGVVYFAHSNAVLKLDQPTVPVVTSKNLADHLKRLAAGEKLTPARAEAVSSVLEGKC
jgi:hypothetical protein